MKEQFELFVDFMKERGMKPAQERALRRQFLRMELMRELHRPASSCPQDLIEDELAKAEQRLKRPESEKTEYTPDKPADWQTAYLITPPPAITRKKNRSGARHRQWVKRTDKKWLQYPDKSWGKAGHALVNRISRSQEAKQRFEDAKEYAS